MTQRSLKILNPDPRLFIARAVFMFHNDKVLFRFFNDKILFRVFSDRFFVKSWVIDSPSGSAVIDSSLGSWVLLFRHAAISFIKSCYYFFLIKLDVLFYIMFSKRSLHWTNNPKKADESQFNHPLWFSQKCERVKDWNPDFL